MLTSLFLVAVHFQYLIPTSRAAALYGNCSNITLLDIVTGENYNFISEALNRTITIQDIQIACTSSGPHKDTFWSAVVNIDFFHSMGFNRTAFAFICNASNHWVPNSVEPGPSSSPENFPLRNDCSFCSFVVPTNADSYDPDSFCIVCNSSVCDGSGQCYGDENGLMSTCCNYYFNSNCVESCPDETVPNFQYECVTIPTPALPKVLVIELGQSLFIDCGNNLFTIYKIDGFADENLNTSIINISSTVLSDAGIYTCVINGSTKSATLIVVASDSTSRVVITDATWLTLANDSIVNSLFVTFTSISCWSTSNHSRLKWYVEDMSTDAELLRSKLAVAAGRSTPYNFTIRNTTYWNQHIEYNNTDMVLNVLQMSIMILSRNTFAHFLSCRSEESGEEQFVTITNYETYVDSRGTDTNPSLGQTLTLNFRVASQVRIDVALEQNGTIVLNTPRNVSLQIYQSNISIVVPSTAGIYNFSVYSEETGFLLASTTVTLSISTPTLNSSGNVTVREGQGVILSCIPSNALVQVEWYEYVMRDDNFRPINMSGQRFELFYEESQRFLRLLVKSATASNPVFRCNVAGSDISQFIFVTVLEKCDVSLAAGLLWNTSYSGDVISYRCSAIDSRFSNVVRVSRLCAGGTWSPIDFSNCTLNANHDPFILLWLYVNNTAFEDENSIVNEITASISGSGGNNVIHSSASIRTVTLDDVLLGLMSSPAASKGQILYQATLNNGTDLMSITSNLLESQSMQDIIGENTMILQNETNYGLYTVMASSTCMCLPYFAGMPMAPITSLTLCVGGVNSPCACPVPTVNDLTSLFQDREESSNMDTSCKCNQFYTGNGTYCTADSDGDSYPDQPLDCSTMSLSNLLEYCFQDTCPTIYNIPQSDTSPCMKPSNNSSQCPYEEDSVFGLLWGTTPGGVTVNQFCGPKYIGNASRFCYFNGTWGEPNVSGCIGVAFSQASEQALDLIEAEETSLEIVLSIQDTLATLVEATTPSPNLSAVPMDLQVTAGYLFVVTDYYSRIVDEGRTDILLATVSNVSNILDIASNVISTNNLPGAIQLVQDDPTDSFAPDILEATEQYGLYLATYLDILMDAGIYINTTVLAAENILMNPSVVDVNELREDAVFPPMNVGSLTNVSRAVLNRLEEATISIPISFIQQRASLNEVNRVRVSNIIFQNLEIFLSLNMENETLEPATVVLSSQVQQKQGDLNKVLIDPISLQFIALDHNSSQNFVCAFWDFKLRNGLGGWSTTGVTTLNVTDAGNNQTMIQCSSNHLTSFAVLVNVAGTDVNTNALQIVSYVGIGLSLTCLLATIIFFLSFGKALLTSVHNFVHLNLAVALFLAYLTFGVGIELAAKNKIACHFVATLLQYLFLAVFCWMLCEGIMLYLMLVVVFSSLSKKWWFFFLLGWLPPILFVIIGLASALEQYGVHDEYNNLQYCWLASGGKHFAIWFFVVPMIVIIIINTIFLIMVLVTVMRTQGSRREIIKDKGEIKFDIVISTIKASVILLPLLGLTWVIGLFAVSQNTLIFAWLFAILNTLQGVFIFFFHVLRHDRIWGRVKKKYNLFEFRNKSKSTSNSASYEKGDRNGKYQSKPKTHTTSVSDAFTSSKDIDEKIPLEEYSQSDNNPVDKVLLSNEAERRNGRVIEESYVISNMYEKSPLPIHKGKIDEEKNHEEKLQSDLIDLLEFPADSEDTHDDFIFDDDDDQNPTISLRRQTVVESLFGGLTRSDGALGEETEEKMILFSNDSKVHIELQQKF